MTCHGGFALDEATRRTWYNPEAILKEVGLKPGMVFMDIGCGNGFFTLLASKIMDRTDIVYAVDSDQEAIERLKNKAEQQHLKNITAKVGFAEKTLFCKACADIIFYSMVLHDFKDPVQVLGNAKKMIKPTGKLVNLDWKKQQTPFGPPFKIRFSEQDAAGLLKMAGFTVTDIKDVGPYHYVVTAKPNERC